MTSPNDQAPATESGDRDRHPDRDEALRLVHEGWDQLQSQCPQAAWASWQQALRLVPDFPAAGQALATLESAGELPAAARASYRFQTSPDPSRRARWDRLFQGRDLGRLEDAAAAFGALTDEDPEDGHAAYNLGLALAWLARNAEAIDALDRAVRSLARSDFDRAAEAWTLAEVLRQGAGAEAHADDLRFAWILDVVEPDAVDRLSRGAAIVPVRAPLDPVTGQPRADAEVFEWLDRPLPDDPSPSPSPSPSAPSPDLTPARLLATLVRTTRTLRLSSPDSASLDETLGPLARALGDVEPRIRRGAAPLPLPLLDAALWTFRLPRGIDPEAEGTLTREAVESYYENRWVRVPRKGLGGLTPLEASRRAGDDPDVRARLTAVVRLREQLGERPRALRLYQGYPFDRLRRRLGLEPRDPAAVDPVDVSSMGAAELERLDLASLDGARLADAFESAAGLGDDASTVRFAAELVRRRPPELSRLDHAALFAPLVRASLKAGDPSRAIAWLDDARAIDAESASGRRRRTFDTWRAEVHARNGDPDAALVTYRGLLLRDGTTAVVDAEIALDGAETLLDNGYFEHARPLLLHARDRARGAGIEETAGKAQALLDRLGP